MLLTIRPVFPQLSHLRLHLPIMAIDDPDIGRIRTRVLIPYPPHFKDRDVSRLLRPWDQLVRVNAGTCEVNALVQSCSEGGGAFVICE